jgi:UDP-N-acetylmuramoyl-L-alanyl-D-glutamate--2,6-diaminopimelate ligase
MSLSADRYTCAPLLPEDLLGRMRAWYSGIPIALGTSSPLAASSAAETLSPILHITHDSRRVGPGTLFCCVRGAQRDGHEFAEEAIRSGAVALLVDHELAGIDVPQFVVGDTRVAMGPLASAVYDNPAAKLIMVGVTGTNGKTTTSHMLESILLQAGRRCAVIGTLTQKRTTPEATDLQERLAELVSQGTEIVVMEVTSHALSLHRVDGIFFSVALFTNLSQDHLDFHETMEAYFRAKAELFVPLRSSRAVVNLDDPHGRLLRDAAQIPTVGFRTGDGEPLSFSATETTMVWRGHTVKLPLAGAFNVSNALGAAFVAEILGVEPSSVASGLQATVVPGRYEPIICGQPFGVVVDFAHTPDGLDRVLEAAQATLESNAKLITVFGCGGDRDRAKRPQMGRIAAQRSHLAFLTSDNPRSESAAAIAKDVLVGMEDTLRSRITIELDRRAAIGLAFDAAQPGDVVVIAGKGHERGQEISGVVHPFDDRDVSVALLNERGYSRPEGRA